MLGRKRTGSDAVQISRSKLVLMERALERRVLPSAGVPSRLLVFGLCADAKT